MGSRTSRELLPALAVFLLTVLVFLPSLRLGLVWEDRLNLIENTGWRGFSPGWWFTGFAGGDFKPLVWLTYSLEHSLWGLAPAGYHLTNVILHGLNAALVFLLIRRLTGAGGYWAFAAALFFSLHPLRVEAVSWITSRKEVLFAFFYFLSLLAYLKGIYPPPRRAPSGPGGVSGAGGPSPRRFWLSLSLLAAFLSYLSKPMAVSLPAVLLLIDWLRGRFPGRGSGRLLLEKAPYLIGAAGTAAAAFYGQSVSGALALVSRLGVGSRIYLAGRGLFFYLEKTLVPAGLRPVYPVPETVPVPAAGILLSASAVAAVTVICWRVRKRGGKLPLFCWLWYLAAWLPVSGFFQTGLTVRADRFSYLPAVAVSLLAAYAGTRFLNRRPGPAAAAAALLVLAALTVRQQGLWRDDLTLWERFVDSESYAVHFNLGNAYYRLGRNEEAAAAYRRGLEYRPEHPSGHQNLALALLELGEYAEAERHCRRALELDPSSPRAWGHLGGALFRMGREREAEEAFRRALELDPGRPESHVNLANVLAARGEYGAAEELYRAALALDPALVSARYNLAYTFETAGRLAEAEAEYRRALALYPGHRSARYNLALLLLRSGEPAAAREQLEELARRYPGDKGAAGLLEMAEP